MAEKIDADNVQTNGYDGKRLKAIIAKIESYHDDLLSERGSYMNACRSIRESINGVFEEARAFNIPKKELKKILKKRELEAALDDLPSSLEGDEVDRYNALLDALGDYADTPLGAAAVKANDNDDADVRPRFMKDKNEESAKANAKALKDGIKPLETPNTTH